MRYMMAVLLMVMGACAPAVVEQPDVALPVIAQTDQPKVSQRQAIENFNIAVRRVEPVAERICRQ